MTAKKCLLTEVSQDRLDEKLFYEFLDAYGWYWHNCHVEGRINEKDLSEAEANMIRYARSKGLRLHFEKMEYALLSVDASQAKPTFPMRSRHVPTYFQVADHLRRTVETIRSLSNESLSDDLNALLKEADEIVLGSQRMIKAREVLTDCYEFDKPDRMGRIEEILRYYQHLWSFAEERQPAASKDEQRVIDIDFVEFIPDWESDYPYDCDRYIQDDANHGWHMMGVLKEHNIIREIPNRTTETEMFSFILNEPEQWCKFES